MKKVLEILKEFFIDGLSGMALGLFATLIIGTIFSQLGIYIPGKIGSILYIIGKVAMILTGAGIGCGVSIKFHASALTTVSSAVAGMVGAYASALLSIPAATEGTSILLGAGLLNGEVAFSGPGEPLGAFLAAITAIYIGRAVSGKTNFDIILTPLACIVSGCTVGLLIGPVISRFMGKIGELIIYGTNQAPFFMGIIVSVVMGMCLTLPISSAALGVILGLSGTAAGAATVGCCANMIGFAVASFQDNHFNGLFAQGIGTSMLQMSNIVKKPIIWLPAILTSAIMGPISTMVFHFQNNASGSGMGTAGLIGPINAYQTLVANGTDPFWSFIQVVLLCFILPGILSYGFSLAMRKLNLIKPGDMRLDS
ncbi:MAG: PTS sugar transporter subunit IIC [Lachnospiraceae bacterium]|nr:PTS sugar transporter subunit IIC [Lachnospiraceae bacterium]